MSKYEPLWQQLQSNGSPTLKLTYDEIKDILGFDIDHSFLTYERRECFPALHFFESVGVRE